MKTQFKNIIAVTAIALAFTSCTNDETADTISGTGKLNVEFDNIYNDANFAVNTAYTNSNGEVLKIDNVKYIVSNIVLTKVDGSIYTVPKSESYFIVDELNPETTEIELPNIPAGNYNKISFGIGVDQEQFNLGATGQGDFLAVAQNAGLIWSWSAGYKFLAVEGTYTKLGTVDTDTSFKIHVGLTGTDYNYTTVTLDLPKNALVRTDITPDVHLFADLSQILDGTNKINLTEGAMIMGGTKLPLIVSNYAKMFKVDHVHND